MITLVKFIKNRIKNSPNRVVTRTLGKIGLIHPETYEVMNPRPQHDEFWFVDILYESWKGTNRGMFVLNPFKKVSLVVRDGKPEPDVVRLIPGTFKVELKDSVLYVYPKNASVEKGPNWILDLETRQFLLTQFRGPKEDVAVNAIVVVFDSQESQDQVDPPSQPKLTLPKEDQLLLDLDNLDELNALDAEDQDAAHHS